MERDVADVRVTIKVKHMYAILVTVVGITGVAVMGWLNLKAVADDASKGVSRVELVVQQRVGRLECLVEQQNKFQIYGIRPTEVCSR